MFYNNISTSHFFPKNFYAKEENKEKFDSTDIKNDVKFVVEEAAGGMMEVESGQLAISNGTSQIVKQYGQDMVNDHTKAKEELMAMVQAKEITLPEVPNSKMRGKIYELKKKSGADFDKAYIDMMVSDHSDDKDLFRKEADIGNDVQIKVWAGNNSPICNIICKWHRTYIIN